MPDKVTADTQAPNKRAKMPTDNPQQGQPLQKSVFIISDADVTTRTLESMHWFSNAGYCCSSCTEMSGAVDGCVQSNVVSAPHGKKPTTFSELLKVNGVHKSSRSSLFSLPVKKVKAFTSAT